MELLAIAGERIEAGQVVTIDTHTGLVKRAAPAGQLCWKCCRPIASGLAHCDRCVSRCHICSAAFHLTDQIVSHERRAVHRKCLSELTAVKAATAEVTQAERERLLGGTWMEPIIIDAPPDSWPGYTRPA